MLLQNYKELATTRERDDALKIVNAGLEAALIQPAIQETVSLYKKKLTIAKKTYDLTKINNIYVVGAGKASIALAEQIEKILGKRITKGIVIDTQRKKLNRIRVVTGTHPLPSKTNITATKEILELVTSAEKNDLIICLISGGGSALLSAPRISLKRLVSVNNKLLRSGATIHEINAVRKHISLVKGGQLAQLAMPAQVVSLIVSDVIDNDLSVIASGPTVPDKTSIRKARAVCKKYSIGNLPLVETPRKKFSRVRNILLITNKRAANAMKEKARQLGYKPRILTTQQKGEARDVGKLLAKKIRRGKVLIATGEPTVTVTGNGTGGRNQEVAVGASRFMKKKKGVVLSLASDGVDFITKAAGGIVDETSLETAQKKGLNAEDILSINDSYRYLQAVKGVIKTGKTETNVGDLLLALG